MSDYSGALWIPVKNFWPGTNSMAKIVIHATASGAVQTAKQLAASDRFNDGETASAHYANDRDGTVVQMVHETDAAWGNCCVTGVECPAGTYPTPGTGDCHLHGLDPKHNYNHDTIAIENIKYSNDNSEPLTTAQYNSLVKLVVDICIRRHIVPSKDTIIGHFSLDPEMRARCPGNFPWDQFMSDVSKGVNPTASTPVNNGPRLSSTGEIADFCDADQFQPAKTQAACGFFSVATVDAGAPVGKPCVKSVAQVISEAEAWYAQYDGSNDISNEEGMTQPQLHQLLTQIGLKYYKLNVDKNQIRTWVKSGFPVIINSVEDSYYDMGLGDTVPYYWNGTGFNHIITLTGVTSDGNFLVRDSANVTDLNNPNSLRPGPRKYDASKMNILWATAVMMHGQQVPTIEGGVPLMGVPAGWKDDGKALHNPANSFVVVAGFRDLVLNWPGGWESWNVPLENEVDLTPVEQSNPGIGEGHAQTFRNRRLEYNVKTQKMIEGWLGQEYKWYVDQHAHDQASIKDLQSQVANLTNELQLATGMTPEEQAAINAAIDALTALEKYRK